MSNNDTQDELQAAFDRFIELKDELTAPADMTQSGSRYAIKREEIEELLEAQERWIDLSNEES